MILRRLCLNTVYSPRLYGHLIKKIVSTTQIHQCLKVASNDPSVIFEIRNQVGLVTLNRPDNLNSINFELANRVYNTIQEWEKDLTLKLVIIGSSNDRAFSVGGDLKSVNRLRDKIRSTITKVCALVNFIYTSKIPYISLIDGFTLGGGVGLSVVSRYRVATERTVVSLPETAIGFYPDIGGSYYLPRLKGNMGMFLALTGHQLKGEDVYFSGIATHYIHSQDLPALRRALTSQDNITIARIGEILNAFHAKYEGGKFSLMPHLLQINKCFGGKTVEEIFLLLKEDGSKWALKYLNNCKKFSPTGLKLAHRAVLEGGKVAYLADALQMEYGITRTVMENNEFMEGIRASLIDRDNNPKWCPATLEEVKDDMIDEYFKPNKRSDFHLSRTR